MALTERPHTGNFILTELQGHLSYDEITIGAGAGVLQPGTVLGKKDDGTHWPRKATAADTSKTACAILYARVDATAAAKPATAVTGLAEVYASGLIWQDGDDKASGIAELRSLFIKVR